MPGGSHAVGADPGLNTSQRFPRSFRLKRRHLLRSLFEGGASHVFREAAGPVRIVVRVVPSSQLPRSARVQAAFAARRGTSGVARTRVRRALRESFRTRVLPSLLQGLDQLVPGDLGLIVMVMDRRRAGAELEGLDSLSRSMLRAIDRVATAVRQDPTIQSPMRKSL